MAKPTRCARCGRENDPSLAACVDCGVPLRAAAPSGPACRACGTALQPGYRFCGACGTAVGAPPPTPAPPAKPGAPHPRAAQAAAAPRFRLTAVRVDGAEGASLALEDGEAICGRSEGALRLADDPTVSPRHARFTQAGGALRVEDLGSVNGTFLRLRAPRPLHVGEELRLGRQLLRLEPLPRPPRPDGKGVRAWGTRDAGCRLRLAQLVEGGGLGDVFPLGEGENAVGREAGEVSFPSDRYVSARHAVVRVDGEAVTLADAGSSNGTFVKLAGPAELVPGDELLVGSQLLRVERR
jgi:pSer/pThr/pTyr-binding forkhead associated (FHA) protein